LTERGRSALDEISRRQAEWASRIACGFAPDAVDAAAEVVIALRRRLEDASAAPDTEVVLK
jgi:hypothetical protein